MRIKISADSTCDLSQELIEKYDIGIVPLYVIKDGVSYKDTLEITPEDIYAHVAAGGALCSTAAVNTADYMDVFSAYRKEYDAVVHFHISSEMSTCYQNACIAAEEIGGVYPVDARNLSTGIGHLVLDAAIMAQNGVSPEEIKRQLDKKKAKLNVSFVVSTLEYLRKGGRCSAVAALGANLLNLKPCIEVKDGVMGVGKKYRGSFEKCLLKYVDDKLKDRDDVDYSRIFITESGGIPDSTIELVASAIRACGDFKEIIHTRAGCTISSHCGPGTLGILYYNK